MKAWLALALQRSVRRRALRVPAGVGLVLAAINHCDVLITGDVPVKVWIQIAVTFLVPYCVSTFASVQARGDADTEASG